MLACWEEGALQPSWYDFGSSMSFQRLAFTDCFLLLTKHVSLDSITATFLGMSTIYQVSVKAIAIWNVSISLILTHQKHERLLRGKRIQKVNLLKKETSQQLKKVMITNFKIASVLAITVFACMFYCATNW
jgi:hypothetical protein